MCYLYIQQLIMAAFASLGRTVAPSLFSRRYHCLSARSRGSLTHSRPYRAVHLPKQTGGIPVLLESILFLTLYIKQNTFTKSVVRCEFDDLKIKNVLKKKCFWGAKETFGGLDTP